MVNRTVFLLLLAIGSGVGLAVPVLSQQTDQIQTLDLNLENFPDQLSQNKELSLDREKFPEHVKELELNLEQFPDQAPDQRGKRKNERLNLDLTQFEKESETEKQIREITPVETTSTNRKTMNKENSGLFVFVGLSFLMLVIFLWRKRGKRD